MFDISIADTDILYSFDVRTGTLKEFRMKLAEQLYVKEASRPTPYTPLPHLQPYQSNITLTNTFHQ